MSKYAPLSARLAAHPDPIWRASFGELETALGFALPKAARTNRGWWKEGAGAHARVWTDAGWAAEAVDLAAGHVTFRRAGAAIEAPQPAKAPVALGDEPAIVASLERPKWHMALVAGGLAVVAGVGALAIRGLMRRRGADSD
jgi:hypothetical protein